MKKSGFILQEIAYITKHVNYQSPELYLSTPDEEDMERYAGTLFIVQYLNSEGVSNKSEKRSTQPKIFTPTATILIIPKKTKILKIVKKK